MNMTQLLKICHMFVCVLKTSVGPDIALQLLQPSILVVLIHLLVHVLNRIQMKTEGDDENVKKYNKENNDDPSLIHH